MLDLGRALRSRLLILRRLVLAVLAVVSIVLVLMQTAFATNTYVINDGDRVLVYSSRTTDPAAVLTEAGLELGANDTYTTQEGLGMSEITVQRSQTITIIHGSQTRQVRSNGETVRALLDRCGILLAKDHVLSVSADAMTFDGMVLTISQAIQSTETYMLTVPYGTRVCHDSSLKAGTRKVLTPGCDGLLVCTVSVYYVNGVEINRTVLSQTITRQPVDEVVAIGTGA